MTVIKSSKIDALGRVVVPIEVRKHLNLKEGDSVDFCESDRNISIRQTRPCCRLCNGTDSLLTVDGQYVCLSCREKINNAN